LRRSESVFILGVIEFVKVFILGYKNKYDIGGLEEIKTFSVFRSVFGGSRYGDIDVIGFLGNSEWSGLLI